MTKDVFKKQKNLNIISTVWLMYSQII
jgi:hypothetical protein